MTIRIFLCSLLLALSASAQTRMPAHQVSANSTGWTSVVPTNGTVQGALDWIDGNWPAVSTNGWLFLAPTARTAQAAFDWIDGYAGGDGLLKGTNIVGFSYSDGQWTPPNACAAVLACYPFLDTDRRDDASAGGSASTGLVSGAVFSATVPAGDYKNADTIYFTNSVATIDTELGWNPTTGVYVVQADGHYLIGLAYPSADPLTTNGWYFDYGASAGVDVSICNSSTASVLGSWSSYAAFAGVSSVNDGGSVPVYLTNGTRLVVAKREFGPPSTNVMLLSPMVWFVSSISGGSAGIAGAAATFSDTNRHSYSASLGTNAIYTNAADSFVFAHGNSNLVSFYSGKFIPAVPGVYAVSISARHTAQPAEQSIDDTYWISATVNGASPIPPGYADKSYGPGVVAWNDLYVGGFVGVYEDYLYAENSVESWSFTREFNGTSDYVQVSSHAYVTLNTQVSMWFGGAAATFVYIGPGD